MSVLGERMDLIVATLEARVPLRIVTRSLQDFSQRQPAQLKRGVYTLVSQGEAGYRNLLGRAARDGRHHLLLVGQIQLGEKVGTEDIEDAEFEMVEEIKAFCRALPAPLACLEMTGFRQSGQVDAPYGWIAVDMEMES